MAPAISTSTCGHVGAVKPSLNGCIHAVSLVDTMRLEHSPGMTSPNRCFGETRRCRAVCESFA
jgi:hypothetical protein